MVKGARTHNLNICLLTDVFPPQSGGSGWSTYYLAKALAERGHKVRVLRPVYGEAQKRTGLRRTVFRGVDVEEILVPASGAGLKPLRLDRAWSQRRATGLLARRAGQLARKEGVNVLHGQHQVSGVAASRAAERARQQGSTVVSVVTIRDYWPLCPVSTRLFDNGKGDTFECTDCHRLREYLACARQQGNRGALSLPFGMARWFNTRSASRHLARADRVIGVSGYVSNELARSGRVPQDRLSTIPNLVDLPSVGAATQGPWPLNDISPEEPFLLFAGKLDTNKGAWQLPAALDMAGVRLSVVVAGDGPLRDRVASEASRLGLDFRFYDWLGNDAVLKLMSRAVALLFPSAWQEPLSRVLLEGCATGAAIVALDTGGTRDILEHGESGWLASDLEGFASGMRAVVQDEDLRQRLRRGARAQAERKFAAPIVSAQVEELYRSLLPRIVVAP